MPSSAAVVQFGVAQFPAWDGEPTTFYDDALWITPETVAATFPGRDWDVDYVADHQWVLEEDWEYARQNEPEDPAPVEGTRRWLAQINPKLVREICGMRTLATARSGKTYGTFVRLSEVTRSLTQPLMTCITSTNARVRNIWRSPGLVSIAILHRRESGGKAFIA
jgi:hypothetical protein